MISKKIKITGIVVLVGIILTSLWRCAIYPATYSVNKIDEVNKITIRSSHRSLTLSRQSNNEWTIDHTTVSVERVDDLLFLLQNLIPVGKADHTILDSFPVFEIETYHGILPLSKFSITSNDHQTFVKPHSLFSTTWSSVELLNHTDIAPTELLSVEPSFWITTTIFEDPQKITGIKISHYLDSTRSFILPLAGQDLLYRVTDTVALYQYLSYFANLSVLYYTSDTVVRTSPAYRIKIFTATDTTEMTLYHQPANTFKGYIKSNRQPYIGVMSWNVFDLLLYPDFLPSVL